MEIINKASTVTLEEKTNSHPCYSGGCQNARMHLPVAPACNIACNYCNRKFDCVNESRPGVTSEILSPEQALAKFLLVKGRLNNLKVVGIAGPGDALANFEATKRTIELIRNADPDITFCLSTNGLYLPKYAEELARLGVTHITVTINTIEPKIGSKIYREVKYEGVTYIGEAAAEILLNNQLEGLRKLAQLGIVSKVNTVMIKGINDSHIEEVVKKLKEYGVFIGNIMQLIPAPGSAFENMQLTTNKELNDLRKICGQYIKQMYHCQQCRADAIGALGRDCSAEFRGALGEKKDTIEPLPDPSEKVLKIAVTSSNDKLVDIHFGHTSQFRIYKYVNGAVIFLENRKVKNFCSGPEECGESEGNLEDILSAVSDCHIILTQRIGHLPEKTLESQHKLVVQTYGHIHEEIRKAVEVYSSTFIRGNQNSKDQSENTHQGKDQAENTHQGKDQSEHTHQKRDSGRKVAVASSDGVSINEHFGNAFDFWIYEVTDNGDYSFIERRKAPERLTNTMEHGKAVLSAEVLWDVEAVLAEQIGQYAEGILYSKRIRAFALSGKIDKALQNYGRKSKIIKEHWKEPLKI